MATVIEYGLIVAGISIAIVTAVSGVSTNSSSYFDGNFDKKQAAKLCAARPAGDTSNVIVGSAIGQLKQEYKCSDWPSISYPTFVRLAN